MTDRDDSTAAQTAPVRQEEPQTAQTTKEDDASPAKAPDRRALDLQVEFLIPQVAQW